MPVAPQGSALAHHTALCNLAWQLVSVWAQYIRFAKTAQVLELRLVRVQSVAAVLGSIDGSQEAVQD